MPEYNGKSPRLRELADSNISTEAFNFVKIIGINHCKRLIDKGVIKEFVWDEMLSWIENRSKRMDELNKMADEFSQTLGGITILSDDFFTVHYLNEGKGETQARLAALIGSFTIDDFEKYILDDITSFNEAPRIVKGIIEIMREYNPECPLAPDTFGDLVESMINEIVVDNYLKDFS